MRNPTPDSTGDHVKYLLRHHVPHDAQIETTRLLGPPCRPDKTYEIRLTDQSVIVLAFPFGPSNVKVLRHEMWTACSQVPLLRWIRHCHHVPVTGLEPGDNSEDGVLDTMPNDTSLGFFYPLVVDILSPEARHTGEIHILRQSGGRPVADLEPWICSDERKTVDFETGRLSQHISRIEPPRRLFGPAASVLWQCGFVFPQMEASLVAKGPVSTEWSTTFRAMMETVLRDAEDLRVVLSYSSIRRQLEKWEKILGVVDRPCLVVIDVGEDSNTLVVRQASDLDDQREGAKQWGTENATVTKGSDSTGDETKIFVTGLRDWANSVFGDPLFATRFCLSPTPDLWLGAGIPRSADNQGTDKSYTGDLDNISVRLLLYECYHTIARLVGEFYRPCDESSTSAELAARKRLGETLGKLDQISIAK